MKQKTAATEAASVGTTFNYASDKPVTPHTELTVAFGHGRGAPVWNTQTFALGTLIVKFFKKVTEGGKDNTAMLQASLMGTARGGAHVKAASVLMIDVDVGLTIDEVAANAEARGLCSINWNTHSHLKPQSKAGLGGLAPYLKREGLGEPALGDGEEDVLLEQAKSFWRNVKGYLPRVVDTISAVARDGEKDFTVTHAPLHRVRSMFIFDRPFEFTKEGLDPNSDEGLAYHAEREELWKAGYTGFCEDNDLPYDRSCTDPARLMYLPKRPEGSDASLYEVKMTEGVSLSVDAFERRGREWLAAHKTQEQPAKPSGHKKAKEKKRAKANETRNEEADAFDSAAEEMNGARASTGKAQDRFKTARLAEFLAREKGTLRILDWLRAKKKEWVRGSGVAKAAIRSPAAPYHTGGDVETDTGAYASQGPDGWNMFDAHDSGKRMFSRADGKHDKGLMLDAMLQELGVEDAVEELQAYAEMAPRRDAVNQALEALNREGYAVVNMGGDARILHAPWSKNEHPTFGTPGGFRTLLAPRKVGVENAQGEIELVQVAPLWLNWVGRKTYYHTAMRPYGIGLDDPMSEGEFNLFRGWAVEPKAGDCSKFLLHVEQIVCGGDRKQFEWLMSWASDLVKFPQFKKGTVIVLRGKKGCGKTTLLLVLLALLHPANRIMLDKPDQLVGRFNGHIASSVLVGSEEAFFAGDKRVDGALKNLITSTEVAVESKGVNIFMVQNHVHIVMCTNEDWAVPATEDERRYFVLDVADTYAEDAKNPETGAYFNALYAETVPSPENPSPPGLAAFAQCLLDWEKPDWVDLRRPPMTDGLSDQIDHGLPRHVKWMQEVLERDNGLTVDNQTMQLEDDGSHKIAKVRGVSAGGLTSMFVDQNENAPIMTNVIRDVRIDGQLTSGICSVDDVYDHYLAYAKSKSDRYPASRKKLGKLLGKLGFERKRTSVDGVKASIYLTPSKADAAAAFEKVFRVRLDKAGDDDDDAV